MTGGRPAFVFVLGMLGACDEAPSNLCGVNERRCDNVCVDVDTDDENCGDCGLHCRDEQQCVDGECVP